MYTLAPSPQQIFIDPDTMTVASNGFAWFYEDSNRTVPKAVYRNTGTPSNPIYTAVTLNPDSSLSLNSSGAFPYFIYYKPYTASGVIDLYYVVVKTSDGLTIVAEGNYPTVNIDNSQIAFIIGTACAGTPDLTDQTQLAEAVSQYVHLANYYADSGTVNTYVAERVGGELEELPCELKEGMRVRFRALHTNTSASTFTFTTKSGTTTAPILNPITGAALIGGEIEGAAEYYQPTVELEYVPGQGWFLMSSPKGASPSETYKVKVNADDTNPDFLINKLTAGSGISIAPSVDNSHVVINALFAGAANSTSMSVTSTAIITSPATGDALISKSYTPKEAGAILEIELVITGLMLITSGGGEASGQVYMTLDNTTYLASASFRSDINGRLPGMTLKAFYISTGSAITCTSRWGVSNSDGTFRIGGTDPSPPNYNIVLTIREYEDS